MYVPGGNPEPDYYDDSRPGANLYTNSLIALDAKTGKERWHKEIANFNQQYFSTMSPIVIGNRILVGTGNDGLIYQIKPAAIQGAPGTVAPPGPAAPPPPPK